MPEALANDLDRLQRFEHEARQLSALNHPNLLSIFDIGAQSGIYYLVSEFLEGTTLRERIAGTPLSKRRTVDYALQIANGLSAAHDKGIVHRDLKPDNVFVTRDERAKILDFAIIPRLVGFGIGCRCFQPTSKPNSLIREGLPTNRCRLARQILRVGHIRTSTGGGIRITR